MICDKDIPKNDLKLYQEISRFDRNSDGKIDKIWKFFRWKYQNMAINSKEIVKIDI